MRPVEKKALSRLRKIEDEKQLRRELCDAAKKGWVHVVTHLLDKGIAVESRRYGRTALALAAQWGRDHKEVVRLLLVAGANPNAPGVVDECGVESLAILLAAGGDVDGPPNGSNPLLTAIIKRTKQDKALALLSYGANPNVKDGNDTTALMHALLNGRHEVVGALIQNGAESHAWDERGAGKIAGRLISLDQVNSRPGDVRSYDHRKPLMQILIGLTIAGVIAFLFGVIFHKMGFSRLTGLLAIIARRQYGLHGRTRLGELVSLSLACRILWPPELADKPMFEYEDVPPKTVIGRFLGSMQNTQSYSNHVLAALSK